MEEIIKDTDAEKLAFLRERLAELVDEWKGWVKFANEHGMPAGMLAAAIGQLQAVIDGQERPA